MMPLKLLLAEKLALNGSRKSQPFFEGSKSKASTTLLAFGEANVVLKGDISKDQTY